MCSAVTFTKHYVGVGGGVGWGGGGGAYLKWKKTLKFHTCTSPSGLMSFAVVGFSL